LEKPLLRDGYSAVQDQRNCDNGCTKPHHAFGAFALHQTLVSQTALVFEQTAQYKISKIKLSISMIAVTPATARTKASLASW
jgi:hypothetical protein